MMCSRLAWYYHSNGTVFGSFHNSDPKDKTEESVVKIENLPEFSAGSKITVTLSAGTVPFSKDGVKVHSLVLPKDIQHRDQWKNGAAPHPPPMFSLAVSIGRSPLLEIFGGGTTELTLL